MTDDWVETTLGELCDIRGGGTPSTKEPAYWGGDVVWLTPTEVVKADGGRIDASERTITETGLAGSSAKLLPAGTVLLTTRASVGFTAIAGIPLTTNQGFQSLIPSDAVLSDYLMLWIQGHRDEFASRAGGSTFPEISKAKVASIPIAVPSLPVQRRIVDLLAHLDNHLANLQTERDALGHVNQALMESLTGPRDAWPEHLISEVTTFAGGYAFSDKYQGKSSGDIPFFKVSDMNHSADQKHLESAANYVSRETLREMKAKSWPEGTTVFPKVGAALLTEKRRLLAREAAFDNNCMGLVPNDDILPEFLYARMCCVRLGEFAQPGAVPSVNQSHVGNISIWLPPIEEQREIVAVLQSSHEATSELDLEIMRLKETRGALLSGLLGAHFGIPSTYDSLLTEVA